MRSWYLREEIEIKDSMFAHSPAELSRLMTNFHYKFNNNFKFDIINLKSDV